MFSDKTSNIYKMNTKEYQKLLKENIIVTCKKAPIKLKKAANSEAKNITKKLELSERINYLLRSPAYITIKDHKDNFLSKATCFCSNWNIIHSYNNSFYFINCFTCNSGF